MALVRMRIAIICKESMLVSFLQRFNSNNNNIPTNAYKRRYVPPHLYPFLQRKNIFIYILGIT